MNPQPSQPAPDEHRPLRALVTGGAGFIGSHLVHHLLDRGDTVTVVDNLSTGRRSNLSGDRPAADRLRFIEADLSEGLSQLGAGERFDEVYHLAAAVGVRRVLERPIESIETNIIETVALARYAVAHGPAPDRPARTLFASTSEVYGKSAKFPFHEDDDCVYGPTTAWRWSYACSKAIDEHLALAHHAAHGLPAVIVRFFNIVGPRQVGEYGMVLPNFIERALRDEPIEVYGDGRQSRCFCDVRDAAPVLPALLANPASHGRVVNLGSDTPITISDLAERVLRVLNPGGAKRNVPYDEAYSPGFEDLRQRQPDLTRLRSLVPFHPERTIEDTIRDIAHDLSGARGAEAELKR